MTDRPIIFSGGMVNALLQGRKFQTRRVLKPQPSGCPEFHEPMSDEDGYWAVFDGDEVAHRVRVPYAPGDRLWVREAFWVCEECAHLNHAEGANSSGNPGRKCCANCDALLPRAKKSPIHMPRWASRITLLVTDVRVQRLREISEDDAKAEGVVSAPFPGGLRWSVEGMADDAWLATAREAFRCLWYRIHGPNAWDANPWVAAISFEVRRGNIDEVRS